MPNNPKKCEDKVELETVYILLVVMIALAVFKFGMFMEKLWSGGTDLKICKSEVIILRHLLLTQD